MNFKSCTIFCFAFLFCITLLSQDNSNNKSLLNIKLGLSQESVKDIVFSDLKFHGIVPSFGIAFEKEKANTHLSIFANGKYGKIDYDNKYFKSDFIDMNLGFKYAKVLPNKFLSDLYLGTVINAGLNILDYDGYENGSWMSGYSLGFFARKKFSFGEKQNLVAELHYPVIALLSRPQYAGRDEFVFANTDKISKILFTRNKLYSIDKFINPLIKIRYNYSLEKLNLFSSLNYEFLYLDSTIKNYRNSIGLHVGVFFNLNSKNQ